MERLLHVLGRPIETLARAVTVIETAKMNGIDPQAYLAEVFDRIHMANKLDELLP